MGGRIAAADGKQVAVWDASLGRRIFAVTNESNGIAWSSDGTLLAGTSGTLWSSLDGNAVAQIGTHANLIRWAPNSQRLLAVDDRSAADRMARRKFRWQSMVR
jgi:hypothetical protein